MAATVFLLLSFAQQEGHLKVDQLARMRALRAEQAYQRDPGSYANAYNLALAYLQIQSIDKSRNIVNELLKRED